jgi:serine/threonine protein kinase
VGLEEGLGIALKLAKATAALHRSGIIHRDIKPSNVMLLPDGVVRLIDFGLARVPGIEEAAANDPAGVPGTPSYMAPELFSGASRGDAETDVYALGVTLYRMFSGGAFPYGETRSFAPPRATTPTHLARHRADLPAWLDATLLQAAALAREDRFADPIDLVLALETGETFRPVRVQRSLYDRNPLLFWKTVSAVLALVILGLLVFRL